MEGAERLLHHHAADAADHPHFIRRVVAQSLQHIAHRMVRRPVQHPAEIVLQIAVKSLLRLQRPAIIQHEKPPMRRAVRRRHLPDLPRIPAEIVHRDGEEASPRRLRRERRRPGHVTSAWTPRWRCRRGFAALNSARSSVRASECSPNRGSGGVSPRRDSAPPRSPAAARCRRCPRGSPAALRSGTRAHWRTRRR